MILVPSHDEIKIELIEDIFLITQNDEMRQIEHQIEIEGITNMRGFIAGLRKFVDQQESDQGDNLKDHSDGSTS